MQKFEDTILFGKGRYFASCLSPRTKVCGVKLSFLTVLDTEQHDEEGLPKVIFQQDVREVPSFKAVKTAILTGKELVK